MKDDTLEIRRILQEVATKGAYELGHVRWIEDIANRKVAALRKGLKDLLAISDCTHD